MTEKDISNRITQLRLQKNVSEYKMPNRRDDGGGHAQNDEQRHHDGEELAE